MKKGKYLASIAIILAVLGGCGDKNEKDIISNDGVSDSITAADSSFAEILNELAQLEAEHSENSEPNRDTLEQNIPEEVLVNETPIEQPQINKNSSSELGDTLQNIEEYTEEIEKPEEIKNVECSEENVDISNALESFDSVGFLFDGNEYSFPLNYEELRKNGWILKDSYLSSEYGLPSIIEKELYINDLSYEEGLSKKYSLKCDAYTKGVCVLDSYSLRVAEGTGDVYMLEISAGFLGAMDETYPDISLPCGVTWGMSKEDIWNVYGKTTEDNFLSSVDSITSLVYNAEGVTLQLMVNSNNGLYSVVFYDKNILDG